MRIALKNPNSREVKKVKVGWSWTLFLFSGFFGIPLFLRRLHIWGAIFFALWAIQVVVSTVMGDEENWNRETTVEMLVYYFVILAVYLGFSIFLGMRGNEMTAKQYLENGWFFVEPDSEMSRQARIRWGIYENELREVPSQVQVQDVVAHLERLAELKAKGVLTEDEFQAQKRRVLQ